MRNKIFAILSVAVFILGISKLSVAMMCGSHGGGGHSDHTEAAETNSFAQKAVEEVGNKTCPISGEEIDEGTKAAYEYKGKAYNFCCPACIDEFKKDPKKYIEKIEEQG